MDSWLMMDLDGVLRRWDVAGDRELETAHGLPPGSIGEAAFGPGSRLQDAGTGVISDQEWRKHVTTRLADLGAPDAAAASAQWSVSAGAVDHEVLDVVRSARRAGWRVAVLTNATTRLAQDLGALGLDREVDLVVNSAEHGVAKPDPAYFSRACDLAGVRPERCVFIDDSRANVAAATRMGMSAHLFSGPGALAELLGLDGEPPAAP